MPLSQQQGKTITVLLLSFIFVVFGAVYFKAESGAASVVTMAGEKSLAIYKAEVAENEAKLKVEESNILRSSTTTSFEGGISENSPFEGSTDSDRGGM